MTRAAHQQADVVRLKRLGIDTYQELVVFMARSSPVCRSEGWGAQSRVLVALNGRSIVATLNVTTNGLLAPDEASLSEAAWLALGATNGDLVRLSHAGPVDSLSALRAKVYGEKLSEQAIQSIIRDIVAGRYADIELAAFVTAFAREKVDVDEATALTRAMVDTGDRLYWGRSPIVDKHCVGGLPGNRTSMIVVPIVAAAGLTIPKTSSRAITSPAGTADAMETIAPVDLGLEKMRSVVEQEGACIVWGGRVRLAPADDVIIGVEQPLDFDSPAQLVASILSKKAAAGSTHVVIDMPHRSNGEGAIDGSRRSSGRAHSNRGRSHRHVTARRSLRRHTACRPRHRPGARGARCSQCAARRTRRAGRSPQARARVGRRGDRDWRRAPAGQGIARATEMLDTGQALKKFEAICLAQGGMREPPVATLRFEVTATRAGQIIGIDNRRLSRLAKLAGAPRAASAGLELDARLGARVQAGERLMTIHAEAPGELEYARGYLAGNPQIISVDEQ
jgi:thymidine phosphorylase